MTTLAAEMNKGCANTLLSFQISLNSRAKFSRFSYYYYYYYYHHHHHYHHLLYARYLYLYSETNYVPREYSVAAILLLLFMVLIWLFSVLNLLYFHISTFRSMCAVPKMAVFWSSLTLCFPGMLLMYFLNDF